jgi:hypothetical protein
MRPWAIAWSSVVLCATCISAASAQGVFGSFFPSPSSWFDAGTEFPEARPFGEDLKQLPGQRITQAAKLKGKWGHSQERRNVTLDQVRVPMLSTSLLLDLQVDGSYTLDYQANWGTSASSYATLLAREKGRFSLSGSVLLLEAAVIDVTKSGKNGEQKQRFENQRRAYIVRLDRTFLNIAGACAPYQAEDICHIYRNVWFSLLPFNMPGGQPSKQSELPLPTPLPGR